MGLTVAWGKDGSSITYQSEDVTLPAGTYYLKAQTYNSDESATYALSRLGFITNTTSFVSSKNSYPCNTWSVDYVKFTLDEEATGNVQVGIAAVGGGSNSNAKVFFDNIEIISEEDFLASLPLTPGTYYMENASADGKYLSRGLSWATQAVIAPYGVTLEVSALPDGTYTLKGLDNGVYYGLDGNLYSDKTGTAVRSFQIKDAGEGRYQLTNTNDGNLVILGTISNSLLIPVVSAEAEATEATSYWKFLTQAEYDSEIAARDAEQKSRMFEVAGIDMANEATLEAGEAVELSFTSLDGWTFTAGRDGSKAEPQSGATEIWNGTGSLQRSVTGLAEGLYKVTFQALYRSGWCNDDLSKHNLGCNTVMAYFMANYLITQVPSWYDDRTDDGNPDNRAQAKTCFDNGKYVGELYVYVNDSGILDLQFNDPSYIDYGWFVLGNVKYQKVEEPASYTITVRTFSNGVLSDKPGTVTAKNTANEGETITISYTLANEDVYNLDNIYVYYWDEQNQNTVFCTVDMENLTFTMPASDVYVDVLFGELPHVEATKQWTTLYFNYDGRAKADGPEKANYYNYYYEVPEGLKVYTVVNVDREENVVEVEEMDYVMADMPMLIERTDNTKTLFPLTAADPSETPEYDYYHFYGTSYDWSIPNVANSSYYIYVLNDGVFRLADGGVLPANRCYVELYKGGGSIKAPEVLTIKKREGESTGIETIDNSQLAIDN